jgi:hypothetical protein
MSDYILNPANLTVPNTDFNKLFGQYTQFIYQQLRQRYYNDTGFFAMAPIALKNFYFTTLKRNLEWFRGAVPGIHPYGIFPCFQGSSACNCVANMVSAGDFRIEAEDPRHKQYIEDMINYKKVRKKLKRSLPMWLACGFMLAVIDVNGKDEWTINYSNGNRYFVEVDDEGKVLAFRRMIMFRSSSIDNTDKGYYLVEDRWLKSIEGRNRCFHAYQVYQGKSSAQDINSTLSPCFNPPDKILNELRQKLGVYELNTIYELPFENHIGAVVINATKTCLGIEDHPELSDSILDGAQTFLLEYDQTFTSKQKDRIMADKGVIVPEAMLPTDFTVSSPETYNQYLNYVDLKKNGLSNVFRSVKSMAPDKQAPFFFQSDYRQSDYNADLDQIKGRIADAIKISPADFGSRTQIGDGGSNKTATEITALTGISKTTVEEMRLSISDGMEELFRVILKHAFNDENAKCSMVFNSSQSADPMSETEDIIKQKDAGLLSRKVAIQRKNPNLSNEEIDKLIEEIKMDEQEQQQNDIFAQNGGDEFDYGQDENITPEGDNINAD